MPGLYKSAESQLQCEPVLFQKNHARILLDQFQETAEYRGWALLATSIMANHFHLVVRVQGDPSPDKLLVDFKAYGTRALNREFGKLESETWWTSGGSKRKLPDEAAVRAAIHYVLHKQPNPLVTWFPESE